MVKPQGDVASFTGTEFYCEVEAVCGGVQLSGSVFHEACYFETRGSASSTGQGGNVFYGAVTIVHGGSSVHFITALTNGDEYKSSLTLINQSPYGINIATADTSVFRGPITMQNLDGGVIWFSGLRGKSILTDDAYLLVNDDDFSGGILKLAHIYQTNANTNEIHLTDSSALTISNSEFNGKVIFNAPDILFKNNVFHNLTFLTKTGGVHNQSDGGNVFYQPLTITNESATGNIRMANTIGDTFHEDVTLQSDVKHIFAGYEGNNYFYKNIYVESDLVGIVNAILSGSNDQELTGSTLHLYNAIELAKTSGMVRTQTPVSIAKSFTFTSGILITDTVNILTFIHGSGANGAHNGSFVSGPVKKVGDQEFEFPVGKDGQYRPIGISAPDEDTDAFVVEYFNFGQQSGENLDSTLAFVDDCFHWKLNRPTGGSEIKVTLTWGTPGCPVIDTSYLKITHWYDYNWHDMGHGLIEGNYTEGKMTTLSEMEMYGFFTLAYDEGYVRAFKPGEYNAGYGFVENIGQLRGTDSLPHTEILYYGPAGNATLFLSENTFTYSIASSKPAFMPDSLMEFSQIDSLFRFDLKMKSTNESYEIHASDTSQGYFNYFLSYLDTSYTHALTYQEIKYSGIYDGVDLLFSFIFSN